MRSQNDESIPACRYWIDGSRCKQISDALTEAREAMDRAYYQSPTNVDLFIATDRVSRALNKVRREVRKNQPGSEI